MPPPRAARRGVTRRLLRLPALLALLAAGGCSVTGILAATTPGRGTIVRDIAYGNGPRRRLDVYTPDRGGSAPVVAIGASRMRSSSVV